MLEMMLGGRARTDIGTKMSYADFQTWLAANTAKYTKVADARTAMNVYAGKYVNIAITTDLNMYGTPYKEWLTNDSWLATIARHAHPSLDVFTNNLSKQPQVLMKFTALSSRTSYIALDRNGYLSKSWSTYTGCQCLDFIYYDYTIGSVMRWNPFAGNDPVTFNGILT
ncbi:hypothetical protein AH06_299 [Erwinia phage AH06]|nr:hypothetical protein AH06_299 [Erwinia phage AH06]